MRSPRDEKPSMTRVNDDISSSNVKGSKRGVAFIILVFVVFMQVGLFAGRNPRTTLSSIAPNTQQDDNYHVTSDSSVRSKNIGLNIVDHPIPRLMSEAEDKFRTMLSNQSKSFSAAVKEYRRRYGRHPPKGFDDWFNFCLEHKILMIDEYDGLVEDLEPFWDMSPVELRRRTEQIGSIDSIDLLRIREGNVTIMRFGREYPDNEVSSRTKGFRAMIQKYLNKLPDMDFAINAKAEGRILIPWEHKKYPTLAKQDSSGGLQDMLGADFRADWHGDGSVWEAYRRVCPVESSARRVLGSLRNPNAPPSVNYLQNVTVHRHRLPQHSPLSHGISSGLSSGSVLGTLNNTSETGEEFDFAETNFVDFDYCSHPWAHLLQGHFFSDWRTIPHLYPVFSPAKTSGYSDIRIPSHYYHNPTPSYTYGWDRLKDTAREDGKDEWEVEWEEKVDKIFWRGATTGGGSSPVGFQPYYQRHRFVRMTSDQSDTGRTVIVPSPAEPGSYVGVTSPMSMLNDEIMDVGFTSFTGSANYPGGMEALIASHRFADPVPLGGNWRYKYLIDLDGMGYSARYLALLASDSAVMKSTVYKEYFEDWIQPWLHYIPLSQTYKEIYNIYTFFSGPTPGLVAALETQFIEQNFSVNSFKNEDGDRRLRRIARAGKQWKNTIGRPIDMEAYVYRLCLEWARLWADDRSSMDFLLAEDDM